MTRSTPQRAAIKKALTEGARPMSPGEIHLAAKSDVPSLGLATVYRAINDLASGGDIVPVELPGQPPRYELREAAEKNHHHFYCTKSDKVFDVEGTPAGIEEIFPEGFKVESYQIVLYGVSPEYIDKD